jgi:hypothetical protein
MPTVPSLVQQTTFVSATIRYGCFDGPPGAINRGELPLNSVDLTSPEVNSVQ